MTSNPLHLYRAVWVIDTEFRCPDGERNQPVCLCAHEVLGGRRVEMFFDQQQDNPFDYADSLFICYDAAAEWKTFLGLGWGLPENVVDLYFEYLNHINGVWRGNCSLRNLGTGLVDALAEFGLDALSHEEKEDERDYIKLHSSYPPEGRRRILDYCWQDVDGTVKLFDQMLPDIDLDQALVRGAFSLPVAWMEHNGLPISPLYREIGSLSEELRLVVAQQVEAQHNYGVYEIEGLSRPRPIFRRSNFDDLVVRIGLSDIWPITATGHFSTDDDNAFGPMAKLCPGLEPLRQARKSISGLTQISTRIGADGRNRAGVWPFGTVTGRNNPRASEFILGRPHWVRNLLAPTKGRAIVHGDIVAAEAGIAADASGDPEFVRIYSSGLDQYIEFAKSSGALSPDAVRDKANRPDIEAIRALYKTADLAIKYGVGGRTLATNLGIPLWQADRMIACHKRTYATYWAWAEAQIQEAYRVGYIATEFGWRMAVNRSTSRNTLLNFPQQAACAELLRLACVLACERGLGPNLCAAHHDAIYLDCAEADVDYMETELQKCFREAGEVVLSGLVQLRVETGIGRYPDHYEDADGKEIWEIVMEHLANHDR